MKRDIKKLRKKIDIMQTHGVPDSDIAAILGISTARVDLIANGRQEKRPRIVLTDAELAIERIKVADRVAKHEAQQKLIAEHHKTRGFFAPRTEIDRNA